MSKQEGEMSFLEHLEVLRWHLIKSVSAILVMAVIAFIFKGIVFDHIILAPKDPDFITNRLFCELGKKWDMPDLCINTAKLKVINTKMAGQFSTHLLVSFIAGIVLAFPYVLMQFWSFVSPALYTNEKNNTRGAVFFTSLLFLIGVSFGYFIILPLSTEFFNSYVVSSQVDNYFDLNNYISSATTITLGSGIVFELPIIIYFLAKIGIVGPSFLRKYRKHAIVLILLLAAIITPPDIFSQIVVSLPLLVLYEVSILIAARIEKKRLAATR
jgi:sec-independent protein translocase protein TatC